LIDVVVNMKIDQIPFVSLGVAFASLLAVATGCSTVGPPKAEIAAADLAIQDATKSKASQYAPLELRMARDKFDKAQRAMNNKEYIHARRLAEEALVDAELAEAKASSEDARRTANELQQSLETLRREAERASRGG
jgi:hypothetical protein